MTATRLDAMPNQPKTPARAARIDDDLWLPFVAKAAHAGQTASDRLRELIARDIEDQEQ